ncbi:putative metal-dependent hydrolase urease superfamily [Methanonatronarchaeum thermophilum]|uniref:Putative metal-dependent hydrolase urease superfamily n=1 Tax=Methanonatronarchaeum thermophilum TaxID=1927129 RepID=A0A1Y3GH39_9EURY|nr:TatD family hydrolase [Methanonatronarchaeum thermophilum]OUJ19514.1 putative metal-dependent hydrolase urease superfamily [Methanonatronarchaeum thermophilum]
MIDIPIFDNHMHLRPDGEGVDAVKEFSKAGGTHLIHVSLPSWNYGVDPRQEGYKPAFEETIKLTEKANKETDVQVYSVLGVHPAELTKWMGMGMTLEEASEMMKQGITLARKYVEENKAIAIGEVGRPHYKVEPKIMEKSNEIMKHGFREAASINCPIQLHTESMNQQKTRELTKMIKQTKLPENKVVQHFANPDIKQNKITPSIVAFKDNLKKALKNKQNFMMETDYIDDPERPGAVLGPKTIPKRTKWLHKQNHTTKQKLTQIHKTTPEKTYNIQIEH